MESDQSDDRKGAGRRQPSPRQELLQHRRIAVYWAVFIGLVALIVGAIAAPQLTMLIAVLLFSLGTAGLLIGWAGRKLSRWLS